MNIMMIAKTPNAVSSIDYIYILNVAESYLLVLNRRNDYLLLWTAFYIEQSHTLIKKLKEYETYKKAKTA